MKLRNKKTGEILDLSVGFIKDTYNGEFIQIKPEAISYKEGYLYGSLAELNEDWEDYTPSEPLIKDPKIRKAVRAWAEAAGAISIVVFDCNNTSSLKVDEIEFAENCGRTSISFKTSEKIDTSKVYTITELCGEEG